MLRWLDDRLRVAGIARSSLRKIFPQHWTFLIGELALYTFVVLVATGVFLTLFYVPDGTPVVYEGPYLPLHGQPVSAAYESVMELSYDVRAGLVMRQIHHWAALVFLAAITVHILRIFFTGAFRRPRELNWLVGIGLLTLALGLGLTGYSLPDDLLSGTGLRIIYSGVLSIPFIGPFLAFLVFGGEFPTETIISRLFVFHVMLLPALLIAGIAVHIAILWRQKHTQWPDRQATEHNVVGKPFWPTEALKSTGLLFLTAAALALMGGLIQVNPVWLYGPFDATTVSSPAQPDWYLGWLDGALRIFPSFEPTILGVTIASPFIPGVLIPGIAFTIMALWPFIEARLTNDREYHQLLQRPRDAPLRTAVGVAGVTFFVLLTLAGGNDVIAIVFNVPVEALTVLFRFVLVGGPIVAGLVAWALCRELRRREAQPEHPGRRIRLRRTEAGGFEEVEEEVE